jgi:hypothetical protein
MHLKKAAKTFKKMAGKAWKSSATFSTISSTISRDNTAGECARQAKLLADFGQRRPCTLSDSFVQQNIWVDASATAILSNQRSFSTQGYEVEQSARNVFYNTTPILALPLTAKSPKYFYCAFSPCAKRFLSLESLGYVLVSKPFAMS